MEEGLKLSKLQKKVIQDLKKDFVLITSSSMKGAIVGNSNLEYRINGGVFWRLHDKGLIFQDNSKYGKSHYVLTELGKNFIL
jgi:predicted transcriptional regulator